MRHTLVGEEVTNDRKLCAEVSMTGTSLAASDLKLDVVGSWKDSGLSLVLSLSHILRNHGFVPCM